VPIAGQELQLRALMSALLLSIVQSGAGEAAPAEYSAPPRDRAAHIAQLAVRYIHDNLHRALPVAEVAAQMHVSPRHLARLMTHYTGVSPADYIERARLDRARHLLRTSTLSLKEVAREAGYGDVHHFTRVFSRRCQMPPGEYRKRGAPRLEHLDVPNIQKSGAFV
jgi:transcriptional regulator GlxA family with amidase domain